MTNTEKLDSLFEESLQAIEHDQVFELPDIDLPEEAEELASLIRLGTSLREVAHPESSAAATRAAQARLAGLAKEIASTQRPIPAFRRAWSLGNPFFSTALLFLFIFLTGTGVWWYGPIPAHAASFADLSGTVEVASASASTWRAAAVEDSLQTGYHIRAGTDSSATLVFFEGTRVTLEPGTELTLTRVAGAWGDVLQVELAQQAGVARFNVVPLRGSTGQFVVNTPAGQASVRGTDFAVSVDPQGQTLVSVDTGTVVVANANAQVAVLAGQATRSEPGSAPQAPAFQFATNDTLLGMDGNTWKLANLSIEVNAKTRLSASPRPGQILFVTGRILSDQRWVADLITPGDELGPRLQFTGVAQTVDGVTWMLNGMPLSVDNALLAAGQLRNGEKVFSEFTLPAGKGWQVSKLTNLEHTQEDLRAGCAGQTVQARGQKLADKYSVAYAEISAWSCQGFGYGEIDQVYKLSQETSVPAADIFSLRRQSLNWGQLKKTLQASPAPSSASETAILSTQVTTPTQADILSTQVITPTQAAIVLASPPQPGDPAPDCSRTNLQPRALFLAGEYDMEYAEIMDWFCQGFGFGEIVQAYDLSNQTGTPVDELFTQKKSGLGWGEIKKILDKEKVNNGNNANNSNNAQNSTNNNNTNSTKDKKDKDTQDNKDTKEPKDPKDKNK